MQPFLGSLSRKIFCRNRKTGNRVFEPSKELKKAILVFSPFLALNLNFNPSPWSSFGKKVLLPHLQPLVFPLLLHLL
jgi:hypothetical protein